MKRQSSVKLRPEVVAFARAMERKLRKHDSARGKRGWRNASIYWVMLRLMEETGELARVVRRRGSQTVLDEAADVGNLAMMVADKSR